MTISRKLKLSTALILMLFVFNAIFTIYITQRMMRDVRQLAEVQMPLQVAILEMEINAGESARAVFDYVSHNEERDIEVINDSEREFERYAREFERLAKTEEEATTGHPSRSHLSVIQGARRRNYIDAEAAPRRYGGIPQRRHGD